MKYDPDVIRSYFDDFGTGEWDRLVSSPKNLMSLKIHQYYLQKYIEKNDRVLEIGAGSGRFTIFLAKLGAHILVSDISPVQLELNKNHITESGYGDRIIDFDILDITDLNKIEDQQFDKVVAIGGPLSYVFEKKDKAMEELIRVTKPGGLIFLGVMSLYGSLRRVIRAYIPDLIDGNYMVEKILEHGNDPGYLAFEGHHSHLFTYKELRDFLERFPVEIVEATSTSFLTAQRTDKLHDIVSQNDAWQKLFEMELKICKEMIDGGSHMLVVLRKS